MRRPVARVFEGRDVVLFGGRVGKVAVFVANCRGESKIRIERQ